MWRETAAQEQHDDKVETTEKRMMVHQKAAESVH